MLKEQILNTLSTKLTLSELKWANEWAKEVQEEDDEYNIYDFYWAVLDCFLWNTYERQVDVLIDYYDDPDVIDKIESVCKELNYDPRV